MIFVRGKKRISNFMIVQTIIKINPTDIMIILKVDNIDDDDDDDDENVDYDIEYKINLFIFLF